MLSILQSCIGVLQRMSKYSVCVLYLVIVSDESSRQSGVFRENATKHVVWSAWRYSVTGSRLFNGSRAPNAVAWSSA